MASVREIPSELADLRGLLKTMEEGQHICSTSGLLQGDKGGDPTLVEAPGYSLRRSVGPCLLALLRAGQLPLVL